MQIKEYSKNASNVGETCKYHDCWNWSSNSEKQYNAPPVCLSVLERVTSGSKINNEASQRFVDLLLPDRALITSYTGIDTQPAALFNHSLMS